MKYPIRKLSAVLYMAAIVLGALMVLGASAVPQPTSTTALQQAATPAPTAAVQPRKGGTLHVGLPVDPGTMDPRLQNDTSAANINDLVYSGLIYNDENLKAQPEIAERWENPDPTHWVFYLRKGVKFQNGTEVKAADVKYTFESMVDPAFKSPRRSLYAVIQSVDVVDDYTVRFNLSAPYAPLLAYLDIGIVPKAVAEKPDNKLAESPLGAGPFKFVKWDKGNQITLARFDDFFKGAPYVDQVILHIIPDNSVRAIGLESGDLDLIQSPLSGADVKRLKTESNIKLTQTTGLGITYLNINNSDPILSDVKVRQAIALLIDRKTIAETIYEGMDQPGVSSLLPGTWWNSDSVKGLDYDPAKAAQLLADAGWKTKGPDGILTKDGKPLRLKLTTYNDPNRMQVAQFMADSFKKAGIALDVGISEWAPFNADVMASKHQLAIIGWLLLVDPDRAFYRQFAPDGDANWEKYTNPQVTDLLTQARTNSDQAKRAALYAQAAQIIVNDAPYAYITTQGYVCAYRDRVQGYTVSRSQSIKALEHTWLSK